MLHLTRSVFVALALCAGAALSSPVRVRSPYEVKESHYVPAKWSEFSAAPPYHVINLQIGLKQGQFDELERHLYEGKGALLNNCPLADLGKSRTRRTLATANICPKRM